MPVLILAAGMYLALAVLFKILAKALGLKEERGKAFQALFVFGNIGFIGIPLIQTLYQGEGIINAYVRKTGQSRAKLSHLMDAETWMDANKAVELGFAVKGKE